MEVQGTPLVIFSAKEDNLLNFLSYSLMPFSGWENYIWEQYRPNVESGNDYKVQKIFEYLIKMTFFDFNVESPKNPLILYLFFDHGGEFEDGSNVTRTQGF